ncbi:MAG: NPCBM/NEW2 domain-containing protein [Planctomycetota bacterium]|nr:NPCBM/NEW2 domain-containing protein [Planctomycetota bacterium]
MFSAPALLPFLVVALGLGLVPAQQPQVRPPEDPQAPVAPSSLRLALEARDGSLRSLTAKELDFPSLAAAGAIALRIEAGPALPPPGDPAARAFLGLHGGDRLVAAVRGGDGDRLDVELAGSVAVPLDVLDLVSLVFPARGDAAGFEAPASGDRLYWVRPTGFDKLDGTLEGFAADGIEFESVLGRRTYPWAEVAALYVEPLGAPKPAAGEDGAACVDLADGGRLHARVEKLGPDGVTLALDKRRKLVLPLAALRELTLDDGSVRFLSTLVPSEVREGYFDADGEALGLDWPFQADRAVTGGPLAAGGRLWARGLGVHAPSKLTFALDGSWKSLRGAVAIDDSVHLLAYKGSVEFALHLDGKAEPAWRSGRVRGGDAPIALPALALEGVKQLELVLSMDERSFVADRADWLRMLLVR